MHFSTFMDKKFVRGGVGVMILNKQGQILLGKRHPVKENSAFKAEGTWTFPGGKMDFGETFENCAKREVFEETSLKLNNVKILSVNNNFNEHAHFVTIGLFCDDFEGTPKIMEPDEIMEWKWFDINKLPKPMYFPTAKMIKNYLEKSFYLEEQEKP